MDNTITEALQRYMALPEGERDIQEGAALLLKLNRNRVLFQNITRNPARFKDKLFYELAKFLRIRLDGQTAEGIRRMEALVPAIEEGSLRHIGRATDPATGRIALGQRADHDLLPERIRALWVENGTLARRIRTLHEKLKLLSQAPPCDRYEALQELVAKDKQYHANWQEYDDFVLPATGSADGGTPAGETTETGETAEASAPAIEAAKRIGRNRKFISVNKAKLAALKEDPEMLVKYTYLKEEMQACYDALVADGAAVGDRQREELASLGLTV